MADFGPKKEAGKAKSGQGPAAASSKDVEYQAPPTIHLQHHHLEKLGMKTMPPVGSKVNISGVAHVGATSENQDDMTSPGRPMGSGDSTPRRSMTLHLHKMEMGGGNDAVKEESQKDGMKGAIDAALKTGAGSAAAKGKPAGKTPTPRGGGD